MSFDVLFIGFVVAKQKNVSARLGDQASCLDFQALLKMGSRVAEWFFAEHKRVLFFECHSVWENAEGPNQRDWVLLAKFQLLRRH
jgi:hypothetical protein